MNGPLQARVRERIIASRRTEMKKHISSLTLGACLLALLAGVSLAAGQPGSPVVNCGTSTGPNTPSGSTGGAATASGSPFAEGTAADVYANTANGGGTPL